MYKLPRTSVKAVGALQGPGPSAAINVAEQRRIRLTDLDALAHTAMAAAATVAALSMAGLLPVRGGS